MSRNSVLIECVFFRVGHFVGVVLMKRRVLCRRGLFFRGGSHCQLDEVANCLWQLGPESLRQPQVEKAGREREEAKDKKVKVRDEVAQIGQVRRKDAAQSERDDNWHRQRRVYLIEYLEESATSPIPLFLMLVGKTSTLWM
jgi:hypothetical protein